MVFCEFSAIRQIAPDNAPEAGVQCDHGCQIRWRRTVNDAREFQCLLASARLAHGGPTQYSYRQTSAHGGRFNSGLQMSSHNECEPQISVWRGGVDPLTRFKLCNGSPRTGAVVLIISRYAGQRQCPKTVEIYGMKRHTSLREGFHCRSFSPHAVRVYSDPRVEGVCGHCVLVHYGRQHFECLMRSGTVC